MGRAASASYARGVTESHDGSAPPPATRERRRPDALDKTFTVTLVVKGLDGFLEVVGGVLLLVISPDTLDRWARSLTQHELARDPNDFVARHLLRVTNNLHHTQVFGAVYLLVHGGAKLVLVVLVLRDKLWAYPWMIGLLLAFIVYQIYRLSYRPGPALVILSLFDAFVAWLTWREYRIKTAARRAKEKDAAAPEPPVGTPRSVDA